MPQRNINIHQVTSVGGAVCLLLSYVPPLVALGIISGVMLPYFQLFCYRSLWLQYETYTLLFWVSTIGGAVGATLVLVSFWRCLFTAPGYVDKEVWCDAPSVRGAPPPSGSSNYNVVQQLQHSGDVRYCRICEIYKPDDAHHCHDCGVCVERMDHHCPWINNCVGKETEKYFIQFLIYDSLTGCFVASTVGYGVQIGVSPDVMSGVFLVLLAICAACFGVVLFFFGGFHVVMLIRGITTIDYVIARRIGHHAQSASAAKRQAVLESVFGVERHWWSYILPTTPVRRQPSRFGNVDAVV